MQYPPQSQQHGQQTSLLTKAGEMACYTQAAIVTVIMLPLLDFLWPYVWLIASQWAADWKDLGCVLYFASTALMIFFKTALRLRERQLVKMSRKFSQSFQQPQGK